METLSPEHVAANGCVSSHPTIQIMTERQLTGSQRNDRKDDYTVALAIEGGGIAGAVPAGMCVVLESTGLVGSVDQIYGTSSGAIDGLYLAAGKSAIGANSYEYIMVPEFASARHLLRGKPIINFDILFKGVMQDKRPVELSDLQGGPDFIATGVNIDTEEAEALTDFESTEEMLAAVRASCAMPVLSGRPARLRGKRITDGAMKSSVPFRMALNNGASHVLALRSRSANYRKKPYSAFEIGTVLVANGFKLAKITKDRPDLYNAEADELQFSESPVLAQIAPEGPDEPVKQLEKSVKRMRYGFKLGALATAKAFGMPEVDIDWQTSPPTVFAKLG